MVRNNNEDRENDSISVQESSIKDEKEKLNLSDVKDEGLNYLDKSYERDFSDIHEDSKGVEGLKKNEVLEITKHIEELKKSFKSLEKKLEKLDIKEEK